MAVCTAHSNAGGMDDYHLEIGMSHHTMLPDGDIRIRQRMEASRHGMTQLESLRSKHQRLMDQLRTDYPDYSTPLKVQNREKKSPLHAAAIFNTVAASLIHPQEVKSDEGSRCESPISSCVSHRSSMSIDSGYTSISSENGTLGHANSHQPPMSYGTYRKLNTRHVKKDSLSDQSDTNNSEMPSPTGSLSEQQIVATAIESTTAVKPSKRLQKSWQRPKSMYDEIQEVEDMAKDVSDGRKPSQTQDDISNLYTQVKPRHKQEGKLMDSLSFSQLTPPPVHRKFGQKDMGKSSKEDKVKPIPMVRKSIPKPPPNHLPQQMPIRAVQTVHVQPPPLEPPQKQVHVPDMVKKWTISSVDSRIPTKSPPTTPKTIKPSIPTNNSAFSQPQSAQNFPTQSQLGQPHLVQPQSAQNQQFLQAQNHRKPLRTAQKPTAQFAQITQQPQPQKAVFHASRIYVDKSSSSSIESSPEIQRPTRKVFARHLVKPIAQVRKFDSVDDGKKEVEEVHVAQPAMVLSRQQSSSYSSESSSPAEIRKFFDSQLQNGSNGQVKKVFTVYAKPFASEKSEISNGKPAVLSRLRKEKVWHESEQL